MEVEGWWRVRRDAVWSVRRRGDVKARKGGGGSCEDAGEDDGEDEDWVEGWDENDFRLGAEGTGEQKNGRAWSSLLLLGMLLGLTAETETEKEAFF